MSSINYRQVKHLLWRAGFGPQASSLDLLNRRTPEEVLNQLLEDSDVRESVLFSDMIAGNTGEEIQNRNQMSGVERQMLQMNDRKFVRSINVAWVRRMATHPAQLREKMTLFWHDHFACRLVLPRLVQLQQNTLRVHALGKFGDLLKAISYDPGMLQFLNNQQNRKSHPNENFARELLELFTLGRGHYTETDIKEAARAFTGWGFNRKGEFVFKSRQHDYEPKRFLGKRGNFDGDDILNILLEQGRTAYHLTEKIYRYFVHPEPVHEVVQQWADVFYNSDYDIALLMKTIFSSAHFYESRNMGARIKSPIEYLAGMMRGMAMQIPNKEGILLIQKVLDQVLLQPPNVAGWPDGTNWINGTSLMMRMKIPQALILGKEVKFKPRAAFAGNEEGIQIQGRMARLLQTNINWNLLHKQTRKLGEADTVEAMREFLLQVEAPHLNWERISPYLGNSDKGMQFKLLCMRLICTPEYQMC
ncbi:MAG: DUF1800 domain-containing protein [Bacteroidota bacterium]